MACLGIDIGTTSIKCCYLQKNTSYVCHSQQVHNADIKFTSSEKKEQSVSYIFDAISWSLRNLAEQLECSILDVEQVSICCQMHGIVMWNDIDNGQLSNLVTWQDQRCDNEFISNIRSITNMNDLHSGYGCGTLAWLTKYDPEFLQKYAYCGTIADVFTFLLCGMSQNSTISDQNAQSWGLFDEESCAWNNEALQQANINFKLPEIIKSGNVIGKVVDETFFIKKGANVYVPIGDLQASVYSVLGKKRGRVFNYGTASQLVSTVSKLDLNKKEKLPSVRSALYTNQFNLATAASLNGGNAVEVIYNLFNSLNLDSKEFDYKAMMDLAFQYKDTKLTAIPVFYGERHDTNTFGGFSGITSSNFTIGDISAAVFRGIIDNLCSMMPDFCKQDEILYAVGISGREILQYYVTERLGDFILYEKEITAAYGAILYDLDNSL